MNSFFLPLFSKKNEVFHTSKGPRKVFFYKGKPVFATGLLISYFNARCKKKTLLIKETKNEINLVSDLGGKVDMEDTCIFDAMAREAWEESSTRLFGDDTDLDEFKELLKTFLINSSCKFFYVPGSKYFVLSVFCDKRLPEDCKGIVQSSLKRFDSMEGSIEREFMWIKSHEIRKITNFNPRIQKFFKS